MTSLISIFSVLRLAPKFEKTNSRTYVEVVDVIKIFLPKSSCTVKRLFNDVLW